MRAAVCLLVAACGNGGGATSSDGALQPVDASTPDASTPDAIADASTPDASTPDAAPPCLPGATSLMLDEIATGVGIVTDLRSPPGDPRVFVAQKAGRIRIVPADDQLEPEPFLDIAEQVNDLGERGLLGLAFHPGYADNRRFFVVYTREPDGELVLAEGAASPGDPDLAMPALIPRHTIPHSATVHNGGWIGFGPDGLLYWSTGDNARSSQESQSPTTLLGKILRVDVDRDDPPEVWALGLRNPWRASFDAATGDLYVADVGEASYEEIDVLPAGTPAGVNLGWALMEGLHCRAVECPDGLLPPIHVLAADPDRRSITGGHVYRGQAVPGCVGTYFHADYLSGAIGSLRWTAATGATEVIDEWIGLGGVDVTTFGVDHEGELLVGTAADARVYRLVPATSGP